MTEDRSILLEILETFGVDRPGGPIAPDADAYVIRVNLEGHGRSNCYGKTVVEAAINAHGWLTERGWKPNSVTPHAPSEGQTGELETEETRDDQIGELQIRAATAERDNDALRSAITQLEAQRDSARKERDREHEAWKTAMELANRVGASHAQLEAQLASVKDLLRESRDSVQASIAEDHVSHNVTEYRKDLYERLVIAYKSTSGQALLDRLAELEKALEIAVTKIKQAPNGWGEGLIWKEETLEAIATAMRKDGNE